MLKKTLERSAFVAVLFLAIASIIVSSAYASELGRGEWRGFWYNKLDQYGDAVLPVIANGSEVPNCNHNSNGVHPKSNGVNAIPTCINSVDELVNFLKSRNESSKTDQQKTGSAFIAYTMIGKAIDGSSKDVSDADWNDLAARLNDRQSKGKINWDITVSSTINTYYQGGNNHDVAYYTPSGGRTGSGIEIYTDQNNSIYKLVRECANPIGNLDTGVPPPTPQPPTWSITPTAIIKSIKLGTTDKTVALPGYKITWTHSVKNEGPSSTNKVLGYDYENNAALGGGNKNPNIAVPSGLSSGHVNPSTDSYSQYVVKDSDVGSDLCRRTRSWPKTESVNGVELSDYACTTVPYRYTLTPSVNVGVEAVEPGSTFDVVPVVSNSGPTKSKATEWQLTKMIVSPNKTYPGAGFTAANRPPCGSYYVASGVTCSTVKTGSSSVFSINGSVLSGDVLGNYGATVDDLEAGSKLCFALSVKPFANDNDGWSHSAPQCRIVGKHPKVQITGGDLSVGRQFSGIDSALPLANVTTSTTKKDPNTFGSWVEYAIFATGTIRGTASGAAFADSGLVNATACSASKLSFANVPLIGAVCTGADGTIGDYASARNIPDIAASFTESGSSISGTVAPSSLNGIYSADDLKLSLSELAPGKTVILKVKGTVTIADNQTYNSDNGGGKYKSILELPQLIIIANKIVINSNVDTVDAWLIAKGTDGIIETCEIEAKTVNECAKNLTVNGPVMAQKLYLRRTGGSGSGSASGDPAEVFNLRADAYLWAIGRASGSVRVYTVNTTELPPRF